MKIYLMMFAVTLLVAYATADMEMKRGPHENMEKRSPQEDMKPLPPLPPKDQDEMGPPPPPPPKDMKRSAGPDPM
ncbi:F-box only protein 11-like isoform X2 [Microplitis mediator]|uniref:F-box only protein 11-like isoform X2 n=1 Tax=Microplitis mediator TaxID=375433 RepID=UPI0025522017|nr:F-box only protein 11-like isoform X2 [Microplitis mediator]